MSFSYQEENNRLRGRLTVTLLLFGFGVILLCGRLVYLQALRGSDFKARALRMQGREQVVLAERGRIRDRNRAELATDVPAKSICINPRIVRDPEATASALARLLKLGEAERKEMAERILQGKKSRSAYRLLRRGVDRQLAEEVLTASRIKPAEGKPHNLLAGIWLEDTPVRVYPGGGDALQLVGSVNIDGRGIEGIEREFDEYLRGNDGSRRVRIDALGAAIPTSQVQLRAPVNGSDVVTTIDRDIQHYVEKELELVAKAQQPDAAVALVLETATADVLAMASWPSIPAGARRVTPAQRRNRAITDGYEPGSTFKIFTAAAALETGETKPVHCGGSRTVGNRTIRCAHGSSHGTVELRRMVEQSCNVAASTLAERVGPDRFHPLLDAFGFQRKTGIEFPGEITWKLDPPDQWRPVRTANIGFGQGIVTTPIQLAAGYNAIGNDGLYISPRLVSHVGGREIPRAPARRVISSENSRLLRSYLEDVVSSGTGKNAKVATYSVGGKTGTAQIAKNGRYGNGYLASFVGFVPARQPKLTILVSVWHPRRGQYGGVVAAPVFREIARQSLLYLRTEPDTPEDQRDGSDPASFYRRGVVTASRASD